MGAYAVYSSMNIVRYICNSVRSYKPVMIMQKTTPSGNEKCNVS